MEKFQYTDLLLVQLPDGTKHLVIAPSHKADVGDLVLFNEGIGTVLRTAWLGIDTEMIGELLGELTDVYVAKEIFGRSWINATKEE